MSVERKKEILLRLAAILRENLGMESNIPVNPRMPHEYWTLKSELRTIEAAEKE